MQQLQKNASHQAQAEEKLQSFLHRVQTEVYVCVKGMPYHAITGHTLQMSASLA